MERRTLLGRLNWQFGEVLVTHTETTRTKSITLSVPTWMGHRPGQHVDVRLTAEDSYQAERSYSIASPPAEQPRVTLTVERLDDGEVSPYLTDELRVGDKLELRGPIGGYFVWESHMGAHSEKSAFCFIRGLKSLEMRRSSLLWRVFSSNPTRTHVRLLGS